MTDEEWRDQCLLSCQSAKLNLIIAMKYAAQIQGPLKETIYAEMCKVFPSEAISHVWPQKKDY